MKKGYTIPLCILCGLFVICLGIFIYCGVQRRTMYESFVADIPLNPTVAIPSECNTYGFPKADNTLRLYETADCNSLSGILNQNICYTAGKINDLSGSYSYRCRGLNPVITPTQSQCSSLYTPQLSECQKNFTCAMNFSLVSNGSSSASFSSMTNIPNSVSNMATAPNSSSNIATAPNSASSTTTAPNSASSTTTAPNSASSTTTAPNSASSTTTALNSASSSTTTSATSSSIPAQTPTVLNFNPPPPRNENLN